MTVNRNRYRNRLLIGMSMALGVMVPSCSSKNDAGVMLVIYSNLAVPDEVDAVEVAVSVDRAKIYKNAYDLSTKKSTGKFILPATFGIGPGKTPSTVATIQSI